MRDLDRWKDKVEISLDGRQIFFLFFGSAVAACLIFVTGVLIGKRIEARALALQPAAIEDPLAALDQLGDADEADEGLTFHKALTPPKAEKPLVEPKKPLVEPKKIEAKREAPKAEPKPEAVTAAAPVVAVDDSGDDEDEAKPEPKKPEPKKIDTPKPALPAARPQVVQQQAATQKPD